MTALTNRPLTAEQALWPASKKLQVVSGLDLLTDKGLEGLEVDMKQKVKDIETVTHVYFFGKPNSFPYLMCRVDNTQPISWIRIMRKKQLSMSNSSNVQFLSPKLKFVLLPTGTKVHRHQVLFRDCSIR